MTDGKIANSGRKKGGKNRTISYNCHYNCHKNCKGTRGCQCDCHKGLGYV
jgi:hypothetical protein